MRILITGSRGFLGSTFAAFATAQGHDVLGLGRTAQPPPGWPGQYAWTDVAHADLSSLVNGFRPDLVFHGAGSASVGGSFQSPLDDLRASVYTFANLLEGIRRSDHRPVVLFPSSAAVYGHPSRLPVCEDDPTRPISPYGFHKLAAEQLGREYAACYGLRVVLGRVFSVLGPRQRRLLLWELFEQFTGDGPGVTMEGTGDETRDFLYAEDVVGIFLRLGEAFGHRTEGECVAVNVASGVETSVRALVELTARLLGSGKPVRYQTHGRLGDPSRWVADTSALRARGGDFACRSLEAAVSISLKSWQTGR